MCPALCVCPLVPGRKPTMGLLNVSILLFFGLAVSGAFEDEQQLLENGTSLVLPEAPAESPEEPMDENSTGGCPRPWRQYGSRCFVFVNHNLRWVDAQRYCIHYGASLASIHNVYEDRFVQHITRSGRRGFITAWVGGTDAVREGAWLWIDSTSFNYTRWNPGEPNNYGNENCLSINSGAHRGWNDLHCEKALPFVCARRI
uniref:C-type lectin domain-containing protein n=1 Tax=Scleropages formosus TaxID=113540 RepID=A0A8C9R5K2_SCLFO